MPGPRARVRAPVDVIDVPNEWAGGRDGEEGVDTAGVGRSGSGVVLTVK